VPTKRAKSTPKKTAPRAKRQPKDRAPSPATEEASDETLDLWVDDGLNGAQESFVNELLADPDRNATRAAKKAWPDQSYDAQRATASREMKNPKVLAAIRRRLAPAIRRSRTSIEEVTKQIGDGMHWDPADILDENGIVKPLAQWPPEARRQLVSIDVEELKLSKDTKPIGRVLKVRFSNRTDYVTLGARMNRMLTDKMEHDIGETLEQVLTKMAKSRTPAP
jgi:phage terminase small subunit